MPATSRIKAGELRHRITILRPNQTIDSVGGWSIADDSIFADAVPAKVIALSGRELETTQQKVSQVTHRITIRWQQGIKAKMNVGWNDEYPRFFQIEAVENPDGTRHRLDLLCIERNNSANNV